MKKLFFFLLLFLAIAPMSLAVLNDADLYWSLDDDDITGSNPDDLSGNGNGGTGNGVTTGVTGKILEAFAFSTSTHSNITTGSLTADETSNHTINVWLEWDSPDNWSQIAGFGPDGGSTEFMFYVRKFSTTGTQVACRVGKDGSYPTGGDNHAVAALPNTTSYHMVTCVWDTTANQARIYLNGVYQSLAGYVCSGCTTSNNFQVGDDYAGATWEGDQDEIGYWSRALSAAEITSLFNAGVGLNPYNGSSYEPYVFIEALDIADGSVLEGLNVTLADGTSNLTQSDGVAYFYNRTGQGFNVTDPNNLYFTFTGGTAVENSTTTQNITGAFVNLTAYNLINETVSGFNISSGNWANTTVGTSTKLYLVPNATNTVYVNATDYLTNIAVNISTTGQDLGNYNLSGLYQTVLTVAVTNFTGDLQTNQTTNVTGLIELTETTTTTNTTFNLLFGDYNITSLPFNGSIANTSITISGGNTTPYVVLQSLQYNTIYLNIYDEISEEYITVNMTVELISDESAQSVITSTGIASFTALTPLPYTIRYFSTNNNSYTQRDYYQTIQNNNAYNLSLYALNIADASGMRTIVSDTSGDRVSNSTVKILRYYASCNCYNVVEMAKTDGLGEAYTVVESLQGNYKMFVDYLGVNRYQDTEYSNYVVSAVTGLVERGITINLGDAYFQSFRASSDFGETLVYNNATKTLSFTWSDSSGIVTRGCLYASYLDGPHYTIVTPSCQNSSTGNVLLTLNNSVRTYKYYAELETSTTYSDYVPFSGYIDKLGDQFFSDIRVAGFLGGLLIVVMSLVFSFSAIAGMIGTAITMMGLSFMGVFTLSTTFLLGFGTLVLGLAIYGMRK